MRFPKTLTRLLLAVGLAFALSAWAQQKPFTQDQVSNMVRDGFGDEWGAKLIEQRGIDFAPTEDFLQSLKRAGASEAFLKALRAAKPPEPSSAKKPLNQVQVFALLAGQVTTHRVTVLVQERGIDFEPTDDYLQEVRLAGGEDELIGALKRAKVTKPQNVDPAEQARQAEIQQHVARGAEFFEKERYADAEQEYRTAIRLDPQNPDAHVALGLALGREGDWDRGVSEFRQALRLDPNNELAHVALGAVLGAKGDLDGEIAEEREALQLNGGDPIAHHTLGTALEKKGDLQGALSQYREAYTLGPQVSAYKESYEKILQKMIDARKSEKLQHWLGKWVFAGPVKVSMGCDGKTLPVVLDLPDFQFEVLSIAPTGEVTASVEYPVEADKGTWGKPHWSGKATETKLVLAIDPMTPGTLLLGGDNLRETWGALDAGRDGDRYDVRFSYSYSYSGPSMRARAGCRDYHQEWKRYLGQMRRP